MTDLTDLTDLTRHLTDPPTASCRLSAESETKAKALVEKMSEAKTAIKEVRSIHTVKDDGTGTQHRVNYEH